MKRALALYVVVGIVVAGIVVAGILPVLAFFGALVYALMYH